MSLLKFPLNYSQDSSSLFALIAHEPWAVFLDSGRPVSQYGRYDIMVCAPFCTLVTQGEVTTIADSEGERVSYAEDLSFKSLDSFTIQSRVQKKRGSTSVLKGKFWRDFRTL